MHADMGKHAGQDSAGKFLVGEQQVIVIESGERGLGESGEHRGAVLLGTQGAGRVWWSVVPDDHAGGHLAAAHPHM